MQELILNKARNLFFNYGLKSISMDDLAKEAGVSKKTVYQVVSDKNELVMQVVRQLVACHTQELLSCRQTAANAVEEATLEARLPFATLAAINHSFFYDLEKFFPEAWQLIRHHRNKDLLPHVRRNLERGIKEGLYRDDIDLELVPEIRMQQLQAAVYPGAFTALQPNLQLLLKCLTRFYLFGITNSKGSPLIDTYLNANTIIKEDR